MYGFVDYTPTRRPQAYLMYMMPISAIVANLACIRRGSREFTQQARKASFDPVKLACSCHRGASTPSSHPINRNVRKGHIGPFIDTRAGVSFAPIPLIGGANEIFRSLVWSAQRQPTPIMLQLSETRRPSWSVSIDRRGYPTVTPSPWQNTGCCSHFFLRGGRISWVGRHPVSSSSRLNLEATTCRSGP